MSSSCQPSLIISGLCLSISFVTVNSSKKIGAGPFSLDNSKAIFQPVTASSLLTWSVNSSDSWEPYFIRIMVIAEPKPKNPIPCLLFLQISSLCRSIGNPLISTTLSNILVNTPTTLLKLFQLKVTSSVKGFWTNRVKLTDPSKHEPYSGSGCSPHGLVARMFSSNQLLFISLTLSIKMNPGSA